MIKLEAWKAMKSKTKSFENESLVEFPVDMPSSVVGTVLDAPPVPTEQTCAYKSNL